MHDVSDTDDEALRARVRAERRRRGWGSYRRAALEATKNGAPISDPTWGKYENGGPLTDKMQAAVAAAFDWQSDWPQHPPAPLNVEDRADEIAEILRIVRELRENQTALGAFAVNAGEKLDQVELAKRTHLHPGTICRLEKGVTGGQPIVIHTLATFFGVDFEDLLDETPAAS